ncbi:MAG: TIGR04211 family SH3 domain-containing protein [Desulfuromonadaceae bacterium]
MGFLLLFGQAAAARTQYVSDELVITFREGKGTKYRIIQTLKTGTPVEILEEDEEYSKVQLQSGEIGYVLKQYLSDQIPKARVIANLEKDLARLKNQLNSVDSGRAEIQAQLAAGQGELQQVRQQYNETTRTLEKVQSRYDDLRQKSEHVVELSKERERLTSENGQLSTELSRLQKEYRTLLREDIVQWFLAGGGVFFVGWIAGKSSRKKRRDFS